MQFLIAFKIRDSHLCQREIRPEERRISDEEEYLVEREEEVEEQEMVSLAESESDGWERYAMPGPAGSVAETSRYLCLCDSRENVFYSRLESDLDSLTWRRAEYEASEVSETVLAST